MKRIILSAAVCVAAITVNAQSITYGDYMKRVYEGNLGYASEQLNVPIAEAELRAVKVFNDPSLSVEYGYNEDNTLQMGQGVSAELSKTFAFGKRRANIDLAQSEKALSVALLDDYLRNLRAEATIAYLDALKSAEMFRIESDAYDNIRQLADGDSLRFVKGNISETDAMQSRLEAGVARNSMRQAQVDAQNAAVALCLMYGNVPHDVPQPTGTLNVPYRVYSLAELTERALDNRSDLVAAMQSVDVADKSLRVAKVSRRWDVDLAVGANYNTRVRNEEAPAPPFTGVTVGLSVPLKFSNFNKGAVRAEQMRLQQAEQAYRQAELTVQTEVMQAYRIYTSTCAQVDDYDNDLLDKAKIVIDSKTYAYQRGDCSLLEVLDARRTYDDVRRQYVETLYNAAVSMVELQRSVGEWDGVDF